MNTMSREKKSQVDDITILRRILDNSLDPSLSYLNTKENSALESVRRRLRGYFYEPQSPLPRYSTKTDSMEPKVTIRTKSPPLPQRITLPPKFKPTGPLPEFNLVTQIPPAPLAPSTEISFLTEELFEIEKIDRNIPEFLEITTKVHEPETPVSDSVEQPMETSASDSTLPEWQPVDEEHATKETEQPQIAKALEIPEFEKLSQPSEPTETIQSPTEVPSTTPDEPSFQKLSRKQARAAKKASTQKEKEEKKLRKIELKQLKKEQQRTKTQQSEEELPVIDQPEETPSFELVHQEDEPAQIQVNYNNFKGIESINEKTAELLYKNGYFSIENLKDATIDDLIQIRGIKRRLARQIKKEIDQHVQEPDVTEFSPTKPKVTKKKGKKRSYDQSEWESSPSKEKTPLSSEICVYKGFTLYEREKRTSDGRKTTIHFFSKRKSEKGEPIALPEGYRIALNRETGVPYLKKK